MSVMRIKDAQGNWQEVAALHGLPGTSVSITSISQSTEDDGYSVVTFSDGKQLRVKNGSKGSQGDQGPAGSGGSGGSTSKYAQPDWGVDANGEILPEMTGEVNPDMGGVIVATPLNAPVVSGGVYTVGFNGAEYQCTAVDGDGGCVLGNGAAMGMEMPSTDEPFVLVVLSPELAANAGFYAMFAPLDGSTSCTFSLKGAMTHKIPLDYVDVAGVYYVNATTDGGVATFDKSFDEIYNAIAAGSQVYLHHESVYYPVNSWSTSQIYFWGCLHAMSNRLVTRTFGISSNGSTEYYDSTIALT